MVVTSWRQGGAGAGRFSPLIEAGNVYVPHPLFAPWVADFIEECAQCPYGSHDDQVDAMTQALIWWITAPVHYRITYQEPERYDPFRLL